MERDRRFGTFPMRGKTRGAWLATTALSMLSLPPAAHAQGIAADTTPQGGTVTAGSANISQGAASTIITQSSERAAINWQSFNVGSAASVKFAQPDASAIALNRVVTPDPSIIAGRIDANGQIVLINQSGVVFTRGSQVNAESIFVSTSNIADKDFMAGKLNFSGPPNPGAAIVNNGQLTAKQAGLVGLVAPQVINNGVITAELGQVVLAGASAFTLDLYGDRLISLDVTKAVSQVDLGGKLTPALVTNRGIILADGGKITLTAADADALVTELIQAGGTMRADSLGAAKGAITLQAVGGNIEIAGNLLARGGAAGTSGGTILAAATGTIAMAPGAVADVSGAAGGGQIALGAAQGSIALAAAVSISSGATLRADATHSGNGGSVLLDSQDNTAFDGAISVQGGPQGGNGGSADISGGVVSLSGTVLDTAINGKAGEVILDPVTLVVGTGTPGAGITTSGGDTIIGGGDSTATSYISPSALDSLTGTIVLSASSLITVASAIDVSQASALSLVSGGAVTISAGVTSGGSLEIDATATIEIDAPLSGTDVALNTAGDATEGTGGGIAAQTLNSSISGQLALDGSNSIAALGNVEADDGITLSNAGPLAIAGGVNTGGNFSLGDSGAVTELSTGTINANELDTDPGPIAGALVLTGNNTIDILGNVSATGNIALVDEQQVSDPSLFVSNPLTIAGMISTPGSFSLDDNGAVMETGGLIDAAEFDTGSGSITGDLLLTGNNTIAALGNVTASGTAGITLVNGQALDLDGILSTPGSFALNNDGAVTENAGGAIDATEFDTDGATIAGSLALGESNTIGTLGDVAAAGAFTLVNSTSLDVAGAVRAPEIALAIDGLLSVNGALAAPQGGEVQLAVLGLDFGTAGSISAPGGTIAVAPYDNGTLDVGGDTAGGLELSGSVLDALQDTGTLILGKALGSIANSVLVEGTLSFSVVSLALDSSGPVENTGTLRGDDIALAGSTLQNDGSLFATLLSFMTPGDFLSDGDMSIGTLSGSVGNDISLGGADNSFGTLGAITAGTITVEDGQPLDIAGTISTGSFSLDADGAVTELTGSAIDATEFDTNGTTIGGALSLGQNNAIGTLGDIAAGGDITLTDGEALSIAGTVFTTGSFSLGADDGVTELPGGVVDAAEFDTDGKDAGTLDLAGFNTIASLGGVTASLGITLANGEPLTLAGIISTTGSFSLNDSGAVTEISGGVIDAVEFDTDNGTISGALQLDQGNVVGTFGNVAAAGDITFANDGTLNLAGTVATPGIFALGATGAVTELSGDVIDAAGFDTNGGTIGGALVLNQDNSIGTLGVVAVAAAFSLQNGTNLDVDALVQAQDITLVDQGALGLNNRLEVATGGTVQIAAAGMTLGNGGEVLAPSGTIAIAPYGNGTLDIAGSSAGGLELSALLLDALDPSAFLTLGSAAGYVADSILSEGNVSLGAPTLALVTSGLFDNTGDIAGQFVTLSGANLENGGTIGATSLDFTATDDFTGDGSIDAGTVAGGAGTLVSLTGANEIGTLGNVSATSGGITLEDAQTLDLAGIVSTPDNFSLTDSGGAVTELAGSAIDAAEFDTDGGRIGGALELGQNNSIATLGAVTASGGITLVNAPALTLASIISTPDDFSLDDSGAVTELAGSGIDAAEFDSAGTTIGGALALNQDNAIGTLGGVSATGNITLADTEALAIAGSVSTPGSFSLKAGGAVTELGGGVIDAAEFDSDGGSITGVLALGQGNSIATLGNVTSSGNITLVNDVALDIDGAVSTPGSFSLGDSGAVTETGGAIDAAEFDSHGGTIGGVLALTGGNSIAALGAVAASGNIVLADARALDLTGLVSTPGSFSLGASGAVTETGGVIHAAEFDSDGATTGGALALTGGNRIATLGNVAASGNIVLKDAQALDLTGLVSTPGSFSLGDSGAVTETGGAIDAAEFDTDGATTGGVLELTGGNRIASLGNVAASGNIVLANGGALTIGGDVTTPGSLSLQDSGAVTELPGGVVDAAEFDTDGGSIGGALVLDPDNEIGTLGGVAAAGNIVLTNGQGLVIAGQVVTPGDFSLYANGAVTELPGSGIDAAAFDTDGATIGGALQLTGANLIGALGNVAAGGNITLLDNEALNLGGTVFTPGNFSLGDNGGVTETGAIDAAEFDTDGGRIGGALVLTGNNLFGVLGGVAASGNISISNGEALDLAGVIATPGIFSLDNNGPVTEVQNSVIDAGEFDTDGGITNGALVLTNLNQIGTLGGISASGDILMTNNEALEIAGIVYTPVIFSLDNNGPVTEVQGGGMNVGEFDTDGGDDGALQLNGPNSIGTLGGVTSSSSISLTENGNMVFTGPVIATQLTLTVNGQLTLQGSPDGGLFVNGTLAPNSQTMPSSQDSVITVNDAGRPEIIQNGIFYINSKPGGATTGPATLFMNAPQSGGIQFAAFPQGLYAPSVDLVLRAGPFGTVTGNVTLAHLSILSAASATLTGSIQGVGGQPAAGKGTVLPNPLPVYQINSCPIGSVNCVLLQIESVPPDNPLQNFDISVPKRRRLNARISLPGIATRDY